MRLLALVLASGCALTSKSAPVEDRYFSPENIAAQREPVAPRCDRRLRIGRITPSDHLQSRIAHRESAVELDLYETLRWTERPENYVRRSLAHELYDVRGLPQSTSVRDPVLDVEVVGFEESREGGRHTGRVQLVYRLRDEQSVIARGEITRDRDVRGTGFAAVVTAIGEAMSDATAELALRVTDSLCGESSGPQRPEARR